MTDTRILEVTEPGARLDVFVCSQMPELSRSRVQKLIEAGHVRVADHPKPAKYQVRVGDAISVVMPPIEPATPQPEQMHLDVLFEDDYLLVINKPAGLVVHPGAGTRDGTLVNALLGRPGSVSSIGGVERPGIVHRLDKNTSGLMLVAKTDKCHLALSRALASREIKRGYRAIALRNFKSMKGTINAPIGRHPTQRTKMAVHDGHGTREATTHWQVLEQFHGMALLHCRLETGRTHQIRVHLAHDKHPILGDDTYGGSFALATQIIPPDAQKLRNELKLVTRQMLHARQLAFVHPITEQEMAFDAEEPEDFQRVLRVLRKEGVSA